VRVLSADLLEPGGALKTLFSDASFDVVLSDMAPATTGDRRTDAARSFYLCEAALNIARRVLVTGGNLVVKIFQGEDFQRFADSVSDDFATRRIFKPRSSRSASREIFVIGLDRKPAPPGPVSS
jgi:23S rRNA (uridine2552-2'-O)-methyltransferase